MPGWGHFPTRLVDAKCANVSILDSCILKQNMTWCVVSHLMTQKHSGISINLETSFKKRDVFFIKLLLFLTIEAKLPPWGKMYKKCLGRACSANNGAGGILNACLFLGLWVHAGVMASCSMQLCTLGEACKDAGLAPHLAATCTSGPCWSSHGFLTAAATGRPACSPVEGKSSQAADKQRHALGSLPPSQCDQGPLGQPHVLPPGAQGVASCTASRSTTDTQVPFSPQGEKADVGHLQRAPEGTGLLQLLPSLHPIVLVHQQAAGGEPAGGGTSQGDQRMASACCTSGHWRHSPAVQGSRNIHPFLLLVLLLVSPWV